MAIERLSLDRNNRNVSGGVTDDANLEIRQFRVDPVTNRLLVDAIFGAGADAIYTDDSAYTVGTDSVSAVGYLADETGTDSIDEGDVGIPRMTLNRKQINASDYVENAAAAAGDYQTATMNIVDDPTALGTYTIGTRASSLADLNGRSNVTLGTYLGESDTPQSRLGASATVTGTTYFFDSDGDNTAQALKASPGNLYRLVVYNPNAAIAFIQLFDAATGSVTVGTTFPKQSFPVPMEGSAAIDMDVPLTFATAITYACTTTATGSGDPAVGLTVNAQYK